MKKITQLVILLLVVFVSALKAQTDLTITVIPQPPYSPFLADYADFENQAIVQVQNNSGNEISCKILAKIVGDNGYEVSTHPDYDVIRPIKLQPFEIRNLNANQDDLNFLNVRNVAHNLPGTTLSNVQRTGVLPEGSYTICLTAVSPVSNQPLSLEGCGLIDISYPTSPELVSPICDGQLDPGLPVFQWTPPVGNIGGPGTI